ncbi:cation transporter [Arthrobacter bambusae]|uniref:cation transporter n=1 Tax=Arthrobacter bambusae TaxID=1338426 RepID=UPI002780B6BD|nr:cation transporter [Arthrobacter bambusae]MDQ0240122.1 divalent metal cation (Fe/Co/Zn/Cd) transporter [Arthrobacter bambusae]
MTTVPEAAWIKDARTVRLLSWFSLAWMVLEGALGLLAGGTAGSVSLIGWALSSAVEGLASIIVIWRFTGSRTMSETAEGRAQKAVAISFWLLAPYIGIQSIIDLATGHRAGNSVLGIVLTAASLVIMPVLGVAKQRLGARLDSGATAGEGTQNLLCAATAAAVLIGLAGNALFAAWWLDPVIGLVIAAVAVKEGREAWKGEDCR